MKKYLCIIMLLIMSVIFVACKETTIEPITETQTTEDLGYYSKNPNIKYMYEENFKLFHNDLVSVENNSRKFGFLNTGGEIVIDFIYDYTSIFWDGAAVVYKDGYYGLIDTSGEYILEPIYEFIDRYPNYNLFVVQDATTHKQGIFLNDGTMVLDFEYDQIPLLDISNDNSYIIVTSKNDLYGLTALDGEEITGHIFTYALDFHQSDYAPIEYNHEWGYVDREGNSFLATEFDRTLPFIDNTYGLILGDDLTFGIAFADGTTINPSYTYITVTDFGYAYAFNDDEEILYDIETSSRINFNFEKEYALHDSGFETFYSTNIIYFTDGTTKLYLGNNEFMDNNPGEYFLNNNSEVIIIRNDLDQYAAIDYTGKTIKAFSDEILSAYGEEVFKMKYSNYFYGYDEDNDIVNVYLNNGILAFSGEEVYMNGSIGYPYIDNYYNTYMKYTSDYILIENDIYQYYNRNNELVLSLDMEFIPSDTDDFSLITYHDNYIIIEQKLDPSFVIDMEGNLIIPDIYRTIDGN